MNNLLTVPLHGIALNAIAFAPLSTDGITLIRETETLLITLLNASQIKQNDNTQN